MAESWVESDMNIPLDAHIVHIVSMLRNPPTIRKILVFNNFYKKRPKELKKRAKQICDLQQCETVHERVLEMLSLQGVTNLALGAYTQKPRGQN